MLTERQSERLPQWLDALRQDGLPSLHALAAGIDRDRDAVIAGLTLPWNSAVVEGRQTGQDTQAPDVRPVWLRTAPQASPVGSLIDVRCARQLPDMGVYLVSVGAEEWFGDEEDGWGEVASALNAELRRRGLPPYEDVPSETDFAPGSGQAFEEKLTPPMPGFLALCQTHLKLAAAIDLPAETPATCDNLDLSMWFRHQAKELATTRTAPWTKDLDTAFYVALFLRAAQHSIRRGCPIACT